jgi:large exoprotein involved in heme utilization and adhesion
MSSIRASDTIEIIGTDDDFTIIYSDAYDAGRGNHLLIETDQLFVGQLSYITTDNFGLGAGGGITVNANDVFMAGNPDIHDLSTVLGTTTFGDGPGGNISITANRFMADGGLTVSAHSVGFGSDAGRGGNLTLNAHQFTLRNGAEVGTGTFGDGHAGNVTITATDFVDIAGLHPYKAESFPSGLFAVAAALGSTGNAGNLSITTPRLSVVGGGQVAANTAGAGNGGNITIRAEEIEVADRVVDFSGSVSGLAVNVLAGASGDGGSLDIETTRLHVYNGGQITAATDGQGNAGIIHIRADEIEVSGRSSDGLFSSAITSSASTGFDAGSITLNSDLVSVRNGALISVSSLGGGNAGNLNIVSDKLYLNNGMLQSLVTAGSEGNLNLQAASSLVMRQGSQITTSATGSATGGNITIYTPALIALENSDITANATDNFGGHVVVNADTILGTAYREQLTPGSDITASSALGPAFSGSVELNSPAVAPTNGLTELPAGLADADTVVVACEQMRSNTFVATGRGGLPEDASQLMSNQSIWNDFRLIESADSLAAGTNETEGLASNPTAETASETSTPIAEPIAEVVEAQAWSIDSEGRVVLGLHASAPPSFDQSSACLNG